MPAQCRVSRGTVLLCLAAVLFGTAAGAPNPITSVRLSGFATPRQGLLEVQAGGKWYAGFCNSGDGDRDYEFNNVQVVCRQLGFGGGSFLYLPRNASTLPSILTGVLRCSGEEAALSGCLWEPNPDYNCTTVDPENDRPPYLITAVCNGAAKVDAMRLSGAGRPSEGRVEVKINGRKNWGTLSFCDSSGDGEAAAKLAAIVCRHLRLPGRAVARQKAFFGTGGLRVAVQADDCPDNATRLDQCRNIIDPPTRSWEPCPTAFGVACGPSQSPSAIRLRGGPTRREGRLEVKLGGRWGSVCDSSYLSLGMDVTEALVRAARAACAQLGYAGGVPRGADFYTPAGGAGSLPSVVQDIRCQPGAANLAACSMAGMGGKRCGAGGGFKLGVACAGSTSLAKIRLAGGLTPKEGRLEALLPGGRWAGVCESFGFVWDLAEVAKTACRQLGLRGGTPHKGNFFGRSPDGTPAAVMGLTCPERAASLADCSFVRAATGRGNECITGGVGVSCAGATIFEGVRLANGSTPLQGRLELKLRGVWSTVESGSDEGDLVAQLACKALGLQGGVVRTGSYYGRGKGHYLSPTCGQAMGGATPARLADCMWDKIDPGTPWWHDDDLGVVCAGSQEPLAVRLSGGPTRREGRLEVKLGGRWGSVCDSSSSLAGSGDFDSELQRVARLACKSLGYQGGVQRGGGFYTASGARQLAPLVQGIKCQPGAASLAACSFSSVAGQESCPFWGAPLGVACAGSTSLAKIRLAGGPTRKEGRLEVLLPSGQWGGVCETETYWARDEFGPVARAVCRRLGLGGGVPRLSNFYGAGPKAGVVGLRCPPGAASLANCSFSRPEPESPGQEECPGSGMGIACAGAATFTGVRLANGSTPLQGRLELKLRGVWSSVHGSPLDWASEPAGVAKVACRMLGLKGGTPKYDAAYGTGKGGYLYAVTCDGTEATLNDCVWARVLPSEGWFHASDLGVACAAP